MPHYIPNIGKKGFVAEVARGKYEKPLLLIVLQSSIVESVSQPKTSTATILTQLYMNKRTKVWFYSPFIRTLLNRANDWRRLFEILPSKSKSP